VLTKSVPLILALCSAICTPAVVLTAAALDSAEQQQQEKNRQTPPKSAAATGSMTGCVDQQDGKYVLLNNRNMELLANLEAEGFPEEGFAKHVGNIVTVRGTVNSNGPRPLFKVRSIEKMRDGCKGQ